MQISAQQKLQQMVANGELDPEDLEGAVIQAGPAALKKTIPVRGKRKAATPSNRNAKPSNHSQTDTPLPPTSEVDTTNTSLFNSVFTSTSHGKDWSDDKAQEILHECRAKMLAEGLLVPFTTTPPAPQIDTEGEGTSDAELDGEPNGGSKSGGKARKKRGKRGARK